MHIFVPLVRCVFLIAYHETHTSFKTGMFDLEKEQSFLSRKGWLVYYLEKEQSFVSRDIIHETKFPFLEELQLDHVEITSSSNQHLAIFDDIDTSPRKVVQQIIPPQVFMTGELYLRSR